ncbi:hypothetical protein ACFBZI_06955 [Moraxella sp. ZJ142]|uniref:hypothetical protein n=1 Tax=Moraxella marmotae TaxID=3344520 RepID=UPI0035D3FA5C
MKKLILAAALALGLAAPAWADTPEIDVVRQVYEDFASSSSDQWINYLGSQELKQNLIQRDNYEYWFNNNYQGEMSECAESIHIAYPGNDDSFLNEINYYQDDDWVVAEIIPQDSGFEVDEPMYVGFSLINENGKIVIDDVGPVYDDGDGTVFHSFKEQVSQMCDIDNPAL